jgi:Na+-translocating ferredoxin:NAD+ oxidoreductase RnfA subunit
VAVSLSLVWVSLVYWALRRWVIVPLELYALETLVLATVIALSSIGAIRLGGQLFPFYRRVIKRTVPVVMINMTVFVVAMGLVHNVESPGQVVIGALAAGLGLLLAIVPIAAVRVHFTTAQVPRLLRGDVPVYLATAVMAFAIQQIDQLLQQFLVPLF